mmetsp:Transcript_94392/g.286767  ORF Transcript_94392/g.286767 Transcript_94392/m.286767 type:complete len:322 (-) Transcript_94392:709-1674(-)
MQKPNFVCLGHQGWHTTQQRAARPHDVHGHDWAIQGLPPVAQVVADTRPPATRGYLPTPPNVGLPDGAIHHLHRPHHAEALGDAAPPVTCPDHGLRRLLQKAVEEAQERRVPDLILCQELLLRSADHGLHIPTGRQLVLVAQPHNGLPHLLAADLLRCLRFQDSLAGGTQSAGVRASQRRTDRLLARELLGAQQPAGRLAAHLPADSRKHPRQLALVAVGQTAEHTLRSLPDLSIRDVQLKGCPQHPPSQLPRVVHALMEQLTKQQLLDRCGRMAGAILLHRCPGRHHRMPQLAPLELREAHLVLEGRQGIPQQVQDLLPL